MLDMMSAADFVNKEYTQVLGSETFDIDFNRFMTVVELKYGVVVETTQTDENQITIIETLFSRDRKIFTIIGRWRLGDNHHEMKSYPRDSQFPLRSKVRL